MCTDLHPQTPPPRAPQRSLSTWDSPTSDYYTDPSLSSPYLDPSYASSPFTPHHTSASSQQSLLHRLGVIGAAISRAEPGAQATAFLEKRIEQLEAVLETALAAPDTQTREPADGGDSGLFVDEDEDEDEHKGEREQEECENDEEGEGEGDEEARVDASSGANSAESEVVSDEALKEAQDVVARITQVATELRLRYEEVKVRPSPHSAPSPSIAQHAVYSSVPSPIPTPGSIANVVHPANLDPLLLPPRHRNNRAPAPARGERDALLREHDAELRTLGQES